MIYIQQWTDKVLRDKAFNIAKKSKYEKLKEVLLICFTYFLIKNPQAVVLKITLHFIEKKKGVTIANAFKIF